jgi:type IV pilus assembly protein PilM
MAFGRFAKLPPVEPKQVPKIVEFEAKQQIPFPIDQVEWDYQVFQQEDMPDVEVGIFAITKERVMQYLSNFNAVGIEVEALTLSPLAVFNAFQYEASADGGDPPGSVLIDIGTQSTDVIIVEGGRVWLRTLPMGGNDFTNALVKAFKLSFPKAEKLKLEARTSKYARQIFQAMRPVFADLVQEVQRSIGYYQSLNRESDLTQIIGFGSTFRLPGLQKFLKQQLQMDVIRPDGFDRISVDGPRSAEFADHAVNLATAYGLALQGVGLQAVDCNIMPSAILHRRVWKAKQPWFAAAAALLLLASLAALGKSLMDSQAFDAGLATVQPQVESVIETAENYRSDFNEVSQESDARRKIENISQALDYRDLWPDLLDDIASATNAGLAADARFATLSPTDYTAWAKLPTQDWPRVFVESVQTDYAPRLSQLKNDGTPDADQATAMGGFIPDPERYREQMYNNPMRGGRGGNDEDEEETLEWRGGKEASTFFSGTGDDAKAPAMKVTLTGITPYRGASRLLTESVIGWLEDNASRGDRAYTIIIPDTPISKLERIERLNETQDTARPGSPLRRGTERTTRTRSSLPGAGIPSDLPMGNMESPEDIFFQQNRSRSRSSNNRSASRGGTLVEGDITPQPPVDIREGPFYRFTIEWFVRLKPPTDARAAEQADDPDETPAENQQAASPVPTHAIASPEGAPL